MDSFCGWRATVNFFSNHCTVCFFQCQPLYRLFLQSTVLSPVFTRSIQYQPFYRLFFQPTVVPSVFTVSHRIVCFYNQLFYRLFLQHQYKLDHCIVRFHNINHYFSLQTSVGDQISRRIKLSVIVFYGKLKGQFAGRDICELLKWVVGSLKKNIARCYTSHPYRGTPP